MFPYIIDRKSCTRSSGRRSRPDQQPPFPPSAGRLAPLPSPHCGAVKAAKLPAAPPADNTRAVWETESVSARGVNRHRLPSSPHPDPQGRISPGSGVPARRPVPRIHERNIIPSGLGNSSRQRPSSAARKSICEVG